MIHFEKKPETPPTTNDADGNRFEQIRKAVAAKRRLDIVQRRPAILTSDDK